MDGYYKAVLIVFGLLGVVAGFYWDSYQLMACANVPLTIAFLFDDEDEVIEQTQELID